MKKVLSLVLAFAMILGSFGFVFASEFSDVKDTEYYSEPVNVLTGFGVIAGYPDGTFRPENVVTRAEMVTMIVAALNIPVKGGATTKRFSDVELTHWAAGYIDYGASVGFVAGYPDGTFKPEQTVSYNEALTMIVAALGYTAESLPGVWPGNFVNKAQSLGILDICRTTGTAGAPRQDVACFLYSALPQYIGYVDKDGAFHTNIGKDGNSDTMLNRLGATPYNEDPYTGEAMPFVVTGEEDSQINLQKYLGAYVTAYQNKDEEIVAIKEVLSEFIEGDYDDLKDDYKFDSAKKVDYISFLNGEQNGTKDYAGEDGIKLAVKLSGKNVKEVYSMQQWEAKCTFRAASDIQDEIIDDQAVNGLKFALDEDDEIDAKSFAMVGDRAALSELAEDDIITVYLNKDSKIVKLEVSTKTVDGTVTKINNAETKFTIGGTAYGLNADAETDKTELRTLMNNATEATFLLDYAGKIFAFNADEETTEDYAIVLAVDTESATFEGTTPVVKLLLADESTKKFAATDDFLNSAGTDWETKPTVGALVKYELNSKDKIKALDEVTLVTGDVDIDKNGLIGTDALKDSTIVFSYAGSKPESADSYEVLKASDIFGKTVKGFAGIKDSGAYKAAIVTGISEDDSVYAFFAYQTGTNKNGEVWTLLYDGEVKSFTVETGEAGAEYTTGSAVAYKLTLDADDIITKADGKSLTKVEPAVDVKTSVSGNVFKAGDASYSLASGYVVYVYDADDDDWTAKTVAPTGRANTFDYIALFDTDDDGAYDIMIVAK